MRGIRQRATFTHTIKISYPYFFKDGCHILSCFFSLLEAKGEYKRKTEVIKIHGRSHENVTRYLEGAESKRSVAEDSGVPESNLRKRLNRGTVPTSLGHFKDTLSY